MNKLEFNIYALLITALTLPISAKAIPISNDNLLVSANRTIFEFDKSGVEVQRFITQDPSGSFPATESSRDLIVGFDKEIYLYNGTFTPYISRYDSLTNEWDHFTTPGFSTVNNISYGGIARFGSTIFATDQVTGQNGQAQGVVALNTNTNTFSRFANSTEPVDLTVGLDGLLYSLESSSLYKYDPSTFLLLDIISLSGDNRSVAVDENGEIFIAQWDGDILHYDSTGSLLNSTNVLCNGLSFGPRSCSFNDIDISSTGELALSARFGEIILTDTALTDILEFNIGLPVNRGSAFVEFTTESGPPTSVPEPNTIILFLLGLIGIILNKNQYKDRYINYR